MKKLLTIAILALASQFVQANPECEAKAVGSNGKPLAGAAKSAFMKKCMGEAMPTEHAECAAKAVGKDGKPLHGAARSAFMKKCVADSGAVK
jgi:hypothetical protein